MRVFHRGFNLFRQFPCSIHVLEDFDDRYFDESDEIVLATSFTVARKGNVLLYFGGGNDEYNHTEEIKLDLHGTLMGVSCSDDNILVLDNNGTIYKINVGALNVVSRVPNFCDPEEVVIRLSVGAKITVAYTNRGNVYNLPEKLEHPISNIIDIRCGREHCLLLEQNGNLYSFGRGSRGQLGHGILEDEVQPKLIEALAGLKIVSIATGGWHSCAISYAGDLYVWGWNGNGQLGLGDDGVSVMATPKLIDIDGDVNVIKIACGNRHTIILLENQKLLGCGWNKYKQLTNSDVENLNVFTYLHDFSSHQISELKCGPWSSALICK